LQRWSTDGHIRRIVASATEQECPKCSEAARLYPQA
jgi:hypothetical protein